MCQKFRKKIAGKKKQPVGTEEQVAEPTASNQVTESDPESHNLNRETAADVNIEKLVAVFFSILYFQQRVSQPGIRLNSIFQNFSYLTKMENCDFFIFVGIRFCFNLKIIFGMCYRLTPPNFILPVKTVLLQGALCLIYRFFS